MKPGVDSTSGPGRDSRSSTYLPSGNSARPNNTQNKPHPSIQALGGAGLSLLNRCLRPFIPLSRRAGKVLLKALPYFIFWKTRKVVSTQTAEPRRTQSAEKPEKEASAPKENSLDSRWLTPAKKEAAWPAIPPELGLFPEPGEASEDLFQKPVDLGLEGREFKQKGPDFEPLAEGFPEWRLPSAEGLFQKKVDLGLEGRKFKSEGPDFELLPGGFPKWRLTSFTPAQEQAAKALINQTYQDLFKKEQASGEPSSQWRPQQVGEFQLSEIFCTDFGRAQFFIHAPGQKEGQTIKKAYGQLQSGEARNPETFARALQARGVPQELVEEATAHANQAIFAPVWDLLSRPQAGEPFLKTSDGDPCGFLILQTSKNDSDLHYELIIPPAAQNNVSTEPYLILKAKNLFKLQGEMPLDPEAPPNPLNGLIQVEITLEIGKPSAENPVGFGPTPGGATREMPYTEVRVQYRIARVSTPSEEAPL